MILFRVVCSTGSHHDEAKFDEAGRKPGSIVKPGWIDRWQTLWQARESQESATKSSLRKTVFAQRSYLRNSFWGPSLSNKWHGQCQHREFVSASRHWQIHACSTLSEILRKWRQRWDERPLVWYCLVCFFPWQVAWGAVTPHPLQVHESNQGKLTRGSINSTLPINAFQSPPPMDAFCRSVLAVIALATHLRPFFSNPVAWGNTCCWTAMQVFSDFLIQTLLIKRS